MRLRFSIRDLLWLTALVALALAWGLDHRRMADEVSGYKREMEVERKEFTTNGGPIYGQNPQNYIDEVRTKFEEFDAGKK